ncbi:hypothetical protein [Spiroplasma endosymbiont of Stenodema calcarata]|uniref:hypothetical protein n=1 Tax=Spiroplasma endosymbiont of Stenodema calcarata TaxID=3139328 RepID=UPI003CCAEE84
MLLFQLSKLKWKGNIIFCLLSLFPKAKEIMELAKKLSRGRDPSHGAGSLGSPW